LAESEICEVATVSTIEKICLESSFSIIISPMNRIRTKTNRFGNRRRRWMALLGLAELLGFFLLLPAQPAWSQDNDVRIMIPAASFPQWMDEVPPAPPRSDVETGPLEPDDPDRTMGGTRITASGTGAHKTFQFKPPKLPDFSKLREKAMKSKLQQTTDGIDRQESETFEVVNLDGEQNKLTQLLTVLANLPEGEQKQLMQKMIAEQTKRLEAARELSVLLPPPPATATPMTDEPDPQPDNENLSRPESPASPPASPALSGIDGSIDGNIDAGVDAMKRNKRIRELKAILFPLQRLNEPTAPTQVPGAPKNHPQAPTQTEPRPDAAPPQPPKKRPNVYQPSTFRSIYQETHEQELDYGEEGSR
jgi:hypothetical protein